MRQIRKKLLSVFLAFCMLIGLFPSTTFADTKPLAADKTTVTAEEEVTVSFTMPEKVEGAKAIEVGIAFDKDAFQVTNVTSETFATFAGTSAVATDKDSANKAGRAAISVTNVNDGVTIEQGQQLLSLTLTPKEGVAGVKSFKIDAYIITGGEIGMDDIAPAISDEDKIITVTIESDEPAGVSVAGTIKSWDDENNLKVSLYDASLSDDEIRNDMKNGQPAKAREEQAELGEASSKVVAYEFKGLSEGSYKIGIFKPGKYIVKVIPITVGSENITVDETQLRLYGDVSGDGKVNNTDVIQMKRYLQHMGSVFDNLSEEALEEMYIAANVTAYSQNDTEINMADTLQINRYYLKATMHKDNCDSVFDSMP